MTDSELERLLGDLARTRVAVIGDVCLDVSWFLDPSRSEESVETGLPTRPVHDAWCMPGGATHVAANLTALGCGRVRLIGVLGDDLWGRELRRILDAAGIDASGCITQDRDWDTQTYVKPYLAGVEDSRFDFGNFNVLHDASASALVESLTDALDEVDIVVVNEQALSGIHTPAFRAELIDLMERRRDVRFLADTRHAFAFLPPAGQKMTVHEAMRLCGISGDPEHEEVARAATEALAARSGGPVVVTRGSQGCLARDAEGCHMVPPVPARGIVDTTGAGDAFLAGLAAGLAAGRSLRTAAEFGTLAAGVTVRKLHQAGIATSDEIRALAADITDPPA